MLPVIALDRVNVHVAGRPVLHDISWRLAPGEHWAFSGANGSGKSTLLRVIAGSQWIDADGGTRTYSPDGLRQDVVARAAGWIRYVSAEQHERYVRLGLPVTGRDVVQSGFDDSLYVARTPTAERSARVDALLSEFGLAAIAARPLRELSSGQIRRLLIARALVAGPRVIVLDEYTNGLDRAARSDVLEALEGVAARVNLLVATHRTSDVPAAVSAHAVLDAGRLVAPLAVHRAPAPTVRRAATPLTPAAALAPVLVRIADADVYRGRNLVLRAVNWELRRGEHTAVRGPNGAGKTTFAGLVAGTISAATGARIERFGQTEPFDVWQLKRRIAHVSDDLQIAYDRGETVEAVVASGFPASIGLIAEPSATEQAAAIDVLERLGLTALRGRVFTRLSFGERRRVLIARSLVRPPDIFILDEIWSGLDAGFRAAFARTLLGLTAAGTTLLTIAHEDDDDIGSLTERVTSIEHGTVRTIVARNDSMAEKQLR